MSAPDLAVLAGPGHVGTIDLGGTKIFAAIVAPDGRILDRATELVGDDRDPQAVVGKMSDALAGAAATNGLTIDQLKAVGVCAPSPVVSDTGVVVHAPNLGWHNFPLKAELAKRLRIAVAVENDVRAAVIGEQAAGAGRGVRNWVGLWPGTGIGGGVVLNGELWRGASNSAGEFGHMTIKADGPMCGCGARGHLEALASRVGICNEVARQVAAGRTTSLTDAVGPDLQDASGADLGEAWRAGDQLVAEVVDQAAEYLAIGIASIANCINPSLVVLGGGVVEGLGDDLVALIANKLRGHPMVAATDFVRLVRCQLGDDAGLVGSALLARRLAAEG
jgi:glucokinase